jgi:hypothetical protein
LDGGTLGCMRGLALLAIAFAALTLGAGAGASAPGRTSLTVTYWSDGTTLTGKTVWTLRCNPPGGTLRRPARACDRIVSAGRRLFAPVASGSLCTEIYGGPQVALVTGTVDGRRVWAKFQRRNGCEIARWQRVSPWLVPPGGVTS